MCGVSGWYVTGVGCSVPERTEGGVLGGNQTVTVVCLLLFFIILLSFPWTCMLLIFLFLYWNH